MTQIEAHLGCGPDFAEAAEALSCNTDQIISLVRGGGALTCYRSPDAECEQEFVSCSLGRDADGILRRTSVDVECVGLRAKMQAELGIDG